MLLHLVEVEMGKSLNIFKNILTILEWFDSIYEQSRRSQIKDRSMEKETKKVKKEVDKAQKVW